MSRRGAAMPDHATIPFPAVADKYSPLKRSLAAISMYCTVIDRYVFKARERERERERDLRRLVACICMHACYPLQSPAMIQTREGSFLSVLVLPACCASLLNPAVDY
jgi:hypothetical protein